MPKAKVGSPPPVPDDAAETTFIDARSPRLDTARRDALSAEMTAKVAEMKGLSGADVTDILGSVLAAVESNLPPAEALFFVRKVTRMTTKRTEDLVNILITTVDNKPGEYDGFTLSFAAGRETIDKDVLQSKYPAIYKEVLRQGKPYPVVRTSVREE